MLKLGIAFFAGVLVTLAVVAMVSQRPFGGESVATREVESTANEHVIVEVPTASDGVADAAAQSNGVEPSRSEQAQISEESQRLAVQRGALDQQDATTTQPADVRPTIAPESERAFVERIPVAREVEPLLQGRAAELHAQLEREPREPSWSAYMEAQLVTYLSSKPELSSQFSIPLIQCRSSMCELQAIGYGPSAYPNWVAATSDMHDQPWFEFSGVGGPVNSQDGLTTILWIFQQERGEARPQSLDNESKSLTS
jgi:hypothetical protein